MLASKFRISDAKSFQDVKEKGKMKRFPLFNISLLKRKDEDVSRFGFIVSKKISKLAVQRNRIKRAISEAVRFEMTHVKDGFDVIFLAKDITTKKSTDEIMKTTKQTLSDLDLIK